MQSSQRNAHDIIKLDVTYHKYAFMLQCAMYYGICDTVFTCSWEWRLHQQRVASVWPVATRLLEATESFGFLLSAVILRLQRDYWHCLHATAGLMWPDMAILLVGHIVYLGDRAQKKIMHQWSMLNSALITPTPARYSAYRLKCSVFNVWISLKTYESKVMRVNTFHGDPRPSLWRWRAPPDR